MDLNYVSFEVSEDSCLSANFTQRRLGNSDSQTHIRKEFKKCGKWSKEEVIFYYLG
jgi:hypothetical protein